MSPRRLDSATPENPFCTRFVRPGAIAFQFPMDLNAATLANRLRAAEWRGTIVGPHGSGKSTLLATLLSELQDQGQAFFSLTLHDGQRRLPVHPRTHSLVGGTILVVDGYEQLGFLERCRLRWHCWRRQLGLLVTSHRPVGLPLLYQTEATLPLAQSIVAKLQEGFERHVLPDDVAREFPRYGGNLRELLFKLFDLYEARKRKER